MPIPPAIRVLRHPFRITAAPGILLDRFVYSYIVLGRTITLIDTGVAGCEESIFHEIRAAGRDPSEIARIVLTHAHPDHIGAARTIRERTGCSIAAHPAERAWIEDINLQNRERPVPGFATLVAGPVPVTFALNDGDSIPPGGTADFCMQVLHVPGHSPGSIALFLPAEGAIFCGDAVPVPGDLPVYDDAVASAASLERLRQLTGIRHLLSAWDEPRSGTAAYRSLAESAAYLQRIHDIVRAAAGDEDSFDLTDLTRKCAAALGLPLQAAGPLLARTFAANLRARGREQLMQEKKQGGF